MTLKDLEQIPVLQTRSIAAACEDPHTLGYVSKCLIKYYAGDYGEVPEEDTEANNADLKEGYGHILARYKAKYRLTNDIYIDTHFDKDNLYDINYAQTMICYDFEH